MAVTGPRIRFVAAFLLVLLLYSPAGVSATSQHSFTTHAFQDLGDDDGDGIPNYLDPDDNDDGITDEDTPTQTDPQEPEEDTTPPPNPSGEDDEGNEPPASENGEPTPSDPGSESSDEQTSEESQPQPETQVTSLPNTGTGHASPSSAIVPIALSGLLSVLLLTGAWFSRSHYREL